MKHDKLMDELREELVDIIDIFPTGSSYTCEPPVLDTDVDFVILVSNLQEFTPVAHDLGWVTTRDNGNYPTSQFRSFRRDTINLIVTELPYYFQRYMVATKLAKQFNLLKKEDRCALFAAIVDRAEQIEEPDETEQPYNGRVITGVFLDDESPLVPDTYFTGGTIQERPVFSTGLRDGYDGERVSPARAQRLSAGLLASSPARWEGAEDSP